MAALLCLLCLLAAPVAQAAALPILEVRWGMDGKTVSDHELPLRVVLGPMPEVSTQKPVSVEASWRLGQVAARREVLASPTQNTTVWLRVPITGGNLWELEKATLAVRVDGEVLFRRELKLMDHSGNQNAVEKLSGTPNFLLVSPRHEALATQPFGDLFTWPDPNNGNRLTSAQGVGQASLATAHLPDLAELLWPWQGVVFSPDARQPLAPGQTKALMDYVRNGGVLLLVSGGKTAAFEQDDLKPLLGVAKGAMARFTLDQTRVTPPSPGPQKTADPSYAPHATPLLLPSATALRPVLYQSGKAVLWRRTVGLGEVWFTGLDPRHPSQMEPVARGHFHTLLRTVFFRSTLKGFVSVATVRQDFLRAGWALARQHRVSLWPFFLGLLVYSGVMGVFLARKQRRPKMVAVAVALGLLMAGGVRWWFGQQARHHNQTTVALLVDDEAQHWRFDLSLGFQPVKKPFSIAPGQTGQAFIKLEQQAELAPTGWAMTQNGAQTWRFDQSGGLGMATFASQPHAGPAPVAASPTPGGGLLIQAKQEVPSLAAYFPGLGWAEAALSAGKTLTTRPPSGPQTWPASEPSLAMSLLCSLLPGPRDLLLFGRTATQDYFVVLRHGFWPVGGKTPATGYACPQDTNRTPWFSFTGETWSPQWTFSPGPDSFAPGRLPTLMGLPAAASGQAKGVMGFEALSGSGSVSVSGSAILLSQWSTDAAATAALTPAPEAATATPSLSQSVAATDLSTVIQPDQGVFVLWLNDTAIGYGYYPQQNGANWHRLRWQPHD